jgi:hypothetical protein
MLISTWVLQAFEVGCLRQRVLNLLAQLDHVILRHLDDMTQARRSESRHLTGTGGIVEMPILQL